jgi:hypothetical protein
MSKPISRAEMKDQVNEIWQKCLNELRDEKMKCCDGQCNQGRDCPNKNINCQQCRIRPATHKVPVLKGVGFRWKCEMCFNKSRPSGAKYA